MLQYAISAAESRRPSRKPCRLVMGLFLAAAVAGCSGGDGQLQQAKEPKGARQQAAEPQLTEKFQRLEAADRKALRDNHRSPTGGIALVRKMVARTLTGAGQIRRSHAARTKAEAHWRRAADLDPENMLARASLLALYASEGKTGEALKFFEQLAERQPDSAVNHYFLGQLYARLIHRRDGLLRAGAVRLRRRRRRGHLLRQRCTALGNQGRRAAEKRPLPQRRRRGPLRARAGRPDRDDHRGQGRERLGQVTQPVYWEGRGDRAPAAGGRRFLAPMVPPSTSVRS